MVGDRREREDARKAGDGLMLWKNVPEHRRHERRWRTKLDYPFVAYVYESSREYPEPSCGIAVAVGRGSHPDYQPCTGKAGPDRFCTRHRPDILRVPPVPNVVGESWG
jgi:hypothetical protein